jgi:sugar phosphate isomerase/epimerase
MAFVPGLVSVSFRKLSPRQIVELARETGLTAIEWGGDVHVPPGDLGRARDVSAMTADSGLSVLAYGSYVRLGEEDAATFPDVIETVKALGAPAIRVWAGKRGSADADDAYRHRVIDQARQLATIAADAGVVVCYEYHIDTLTDTDASALALLGATAADQAAIRTLWQPPHERTVEANIASLRGVLPWLHHVHVFHWPKRGERAPLAQGAARWLAYLEALRSADAGDRGHWPLLMEFVRNDDPDQLRADAATLHEWIAH